MAVGETPGGGAGAGAVPGVFVAVGSGVPGVFVGVGVGAGVER